MIINIHIRTGTLHPTNQLQDSRCLITIFISKLDDEKWDYNDFHSYGITNDVKKSSTTYMRRINMTKYWKTFHMWGRFILTFS